METAEYYEKELGTIIAELKHYIANGPKVDDAKLAKSYCGMARQISGKYNVKLPCSNQSCYKLRK